MLTILALYYILYMYTMILTLYSSYIREFLTLGKRFVFTKYTLKYLGKEKKREKTQKYR